MSHLVEEETRFLLFKTLQNCHERKMQFYSFFVNLFTVIVLVSGVILILWSRYRGRMTQQGRSEKLVHDQQIVLSKIKNYERSVKDVPAEREGYDDSTYLDRLPTIRGT